MQKDFQDIMPIEQIDINLNEYFIFLFLFIITGIFIYFYAKFLFNKSIKKLNEKQKSIEKLKNLDIDNKDAKEILYEFTLLAKECVKNKEKLTYVLEQIEVLKYKKEKIVLDEKTKDLLKGYINEYS